MRLTWEQARAWRMARHYLVAPAAAENWRDVVSRIGGLQAQLLSSAELSVWARVDRLNPDAIDRALWHERSLVKLWAMRGTLHLLPASEYGLWQAGVGRFQHYRRPSWYRYFELTEAELDRMIAAIAQAVDDRMLTRDQLAAEVARLTGSDALGEKVRQSWGTMLKPACFLGHLCFAPNAGRNVRFTSPQRWLNNYTTVDPDSAMTTIARRYLAAYAPATREDLAHWWGITPAVAKGLIKGLGAEAVEVDVDGTSAWMLDEHVKQAAQSAPSRAVRLLPAFDPYVIAASPHASKLMPGDYKQLIYRPQGWLSPVLLIDGRMDGIWEWERRGRRVVVKIAPFLKLPRWAKKATEQQAERLAAFLGGELELHLEPRETFL